MDNRLKTTLAAATLFLLGGACGRACGPSNPLPSEIETGAFLKAVQFQGATAPISLPQGMEVLQVRDSWVHLRLSADQMDDRWVNFDRVTAWSLR